MKRIQLVNFLRLETYYIYCRWTTQEIDQS